MKAVIDREILQDKLKKAFAFVPSKQIIPAFENFMLLINGNDMEITATDGNVQVRLKLKIKSKDAFALCVPADQFTKTISLLRENEVTLTMKSETKVEIKSGKSKYNMTLDCLPKAYHTMPVPSFTSEITMNQFMLNMGLSSSEKFVEAKNPNANMASININEINNKIIFTGLTQQLFCRASVSPISINSWKPVSISTDTANKVSSLLGDKGEVSITHSEDKIRFCTDENVDDYFEVMSVTSKINFPNAEGIYNKIPSDFLVINTLELKDAFRRLRLYTDEGSIPSATISNSENAQEIVMTSADNLTGKDGEERISIVNPQGFIIDKCITNDYMIKVLNQTDAAEVIVNFSQEGAVYVTPKVDNPDQDIFKFVVVSIKK